MVLLVFAGACQGEPSPTVETPPNPTSAPAGVLPGCEADLGTPGGGPAKGGDYRNVQPGILLAGSVTNLPPFESVQAGKPQGFDVDVIAEIARRLGLRPEIQGETATTLLSDVAQGRTDVAISAISVRPDRRGVVDFTDPYFTSDLGLTVGVEQARGFPGVGILAGKVLGVSAGSYGETCARTVLGPQAGATVQSYTDISKAFTDLAVGRIGAVLTDLPASDRFVQAVPGLQMVQIYRTNDTYAIAVAKSNPSLRAAINRVLAAMHQDGTYALIYQKWFQVPPPG